MVRFFDFFFPGQKNEVALIRTAYIARILHFYFHRYPPPIRFLLIPEKRHTLGCQLFPSGLHLKETFAQHLKDVPHHQPFFFDFLTRFGNFPWRGNSLATSLQSPGAELLSLWRSQKQELLR